MDAQDLKGQTDLYSVIADYVDLKKQGANYHGCCPFHTEKTPSFTVPVGKDWYYCFGCGAGGDVFDFIQDIEGVDFKTAKSILGGNGLTGESKAKPKTIKQLVNVYEKYTPISAGNRQIFPDQPVLIENPNNDNPEPKQWRPVLVHPYKNTDGSIRCYVIRSIMPSGKKITPTVHWCQKPNGSEGWCLYHQSEPRQLYNADLIAANPKAQVILVEGEKAADAGNRATGSAAKIVFACWPGGTKAISKVDFSLIKGRNVVLIPDNDPPGMIAMHEVAAILIKLGVESIKFSVPPFDYDKGWDIADQDWGKGELIKWCKANIKEVTDEFIQQNKQEPESKAPEEPPEPPPENKDNKELNGIMSDHATRPKFDLDPPFKILGHRKNTRYYMPERTKQVVELSPSAHTKQNMMSLAPLAWWLQNFGDGQDSKSIKWDHAINALMEMTAKTGLFNPRDTIRGRGAWLDEGKPVLHLGEDVYVDGIQHKPDDVNSRFIYELNDQISIPLAKPALDDEAQQIIRICKQLSWENPLSAPLLAGWVVIAPVCGILDWRPHIWVTGPAGSGKSTVCEVIIERMLGKIVIKADGKTTEPGLRQEVGYDARPIIYDEAEAEDHESVKRVQGILDFARICSSGGNVLKGSQSGQAVSYTARSCFCFSAINSSIKHFADETRTSHLILKRDISPGAVDKYKDLESEIQDFFTEDLGARMLARSVANLDTLQANIKTFTDAAALLFNSRRIGDQVGVLLAGAFLTYSTKRITKEAATEWIKKHNWSDHTVINAVSDFEKLVGKISNYRIRVSNDHEVYPVTIGEAIVLASKADPGHHLYEKSQWFDLELRRHGILVDLDGVIIANDCEPMRKILYDSPWQSKWSRVLLENEGAEKTNNKHFVPGVQSRGVKLPLDVFYTQRKD